MFFLILLDALHLSIKKAAQDYIDPVSSNSLTTAQVAYATGFLGNDASWHLPISLLQAQTVSFMHCEYYGNIGMKLESLDKLLRY